MNPAMLAVKTRGTYTVPSRDFPSFRPQGFGLKGEILSRKNSSRTFSVRLCPSLSVPVRSPPFYSVPSYYSVLLHPLLLHPCLYYVSVPSVSSFQISTLGSDPFSVSFDLAFILFPLLFGYNPYQPNPIAPRLVIVFCPLLSYDVKTWTDGAAELDWKTE